MATTVNPARIAAALHAPRRALPHHSLPLPAAGAASIGLRCRANKQITQRRAAAALARAGDGAPPPPPPLLRCRRLVQGPAAVENGGVTAAARLNRAANVWYG